MTSEWTTIPQVESISHLKTVGALGQGGMGKVFKAVNQNGNPLAVKIFHPELVAAIADDEDIFSDFQAAAHVQHPHLCQLKDFYHHDPIAFITMEYVHGKSLRAILKQKQRTPVKGRLQIALETIRGIAALHNVGLIHGDIRPVNIIVLEKRGVKLIDYGVRYPAALCASTSSKTKTYTGYMAPEVWFGSAPDQSSDVYALGVLIYHLLTGRKPRKDPTQSTIPPMGGFSKVFAAGLEALVLKTLLLKPQDRPASALEILLCLQDILDLSDFE